MIDKFNFQVLGEGLLLTLMQILNILPDFLT